MAKQNKSEDTRLALLESGITLLAEQGYHGTGLKQILEMVRVPKGSFYHYFSSKETFVAEVIEYYSDSLLTAFDQIIAESTVSPLETIKYAFEKTIDRYEKSGCRLGCLIGNLAAEIGGNSSICQSSMRESQERLNKRLVSLLSKAQDIGEARKDISAEQLASVFWDAWEGSILRMKVRGSLTPIKQTLETLLKVLFKPVE